jgi:hypothetical protein
MADQNTTVSESVTLLIGMLKAKETDVHNNAAGKICQRFAAELLEIARRQLTRAGVRHREDEEDVMQSVYRVLASGDVSKKYKDINSREELWKLLVTITKRRAGKKIDRHRAAKRNAAREANLAGSRDADEPSPFSSLAASSQSPDRDVIAAIELGRLLEMLDEPLRKIVLWKLDDYTNEQIAAPDKMNCAVRTVERKLERIRDTWEASVLAE